MSLHISSIPDKWELEGEKEMPSVGWYFVEFLDLRRSHCLCESLLEVCRDLLHVKLFPVLTLKALDQPGSWGRADPQLHLIMLPYISRVQQHQSCCHRLYFTGSG